MALPKKERDVCSSSVRPSKPWRANGWPVRVQVQSHPCAWLLQVAAPWLLRVVMRDNILWAIARIGMAYKPHRDLWSLLISSLCPSTRLHRLNQRSPLAVHTQTQQPPKPWPCLPPTPPYPMFHPFPLPSFPTDSSLLRGYYTTRRPPS